jgi:hypothetical protein
VPISSTHLPQCSRWRSQRRFPLAIVGTTHRRARRVGWAGAAATVFLHRTASHLRADAHGAEGAADRPYAPPPAFPSDPSLSSLRHPHAVHHLAERSCSLDCARHALAPTAMPHHLGPKEHLAASPLEHACRSAGAACAVSATGDDMCMRSSGHVRMCAVPSTTVGDSGCKAQHVRQSRKRPQTRSTPQQRCAITSKARWGAREPAEAAATGGGDRGVLGRRS